LVGLLLGSYRKRDYGAAKNLGRKRLGTVETWVSETTGTGKALCHWISAKMRSPAALEGWTEVPTAGFSQRSYPGYFAKDAG